MSNLTRLNLLRKQEKDKNSSSTKLKLNEFPLQNTVIWVIIYNFISHCHELNSPNLSFHKKQQIVIFLLRNKKNQNIFVH